MERCLIKNLKENIETSISGMALKVRNTKYMVFVVLQNLIFCFLFRHIFLMFRML